MKSNKVFLAAVCYLGFLSFFPLTPPSAFHMDETRSAVFEKLPMQVGEWTGTDAPVDQRTYEILETRNVLSRIYTNQKGDKLELLLVGSHKDRRVAHPPEVCFVSSNFEILHEEDGRLAFDQKAVPFKTFVAQDEKNSAHREQVLYLYKVGSRYTTNYYAQQLQFAYDRLSRRESQVLLIRLSGQDPKTLQDFLPQILSLLN